MRHHRAAYARRLNARPQNIHVLRGDVRAGQIENLLFSHAHLGRQIGKVRRQLRGERAVVVGAASDGAARVQKEQALGHAA